MKLSFFSVLAFAILFLGSCRDGERADMRLIKQIERAADKQSVGVDELPNSSQTLLEEDFSENYVESAELAPELGYRVGIRREVGSQMGEHAYVYFDIDGRELESRRDHKEERRGCNRHECFDLIFPVTFVMPDGTAISGDADTVKADIRAWYEANPEVREKPSLEFPVDIIYHDGTIVSIEDERDMRRAYKYCKREGWEKKCFDKVFPLTVNMPDGTEITMSEEGDWQAVKDWYEANPDEEEKPTLQYPVDIIYDDGTVVTIESEEDIRSALEACKDE